MSKYDAYFLILQHLSLEMSTEADILAGQPDLNYGIIDECSFRFRIFTKGMDVDMVALMAARTSGVENQEAIHVGILGMLADPKKEVDFLPLYPTECNFVQGFAHSLLVMQSSPTSLYHETARIPSKLMIKFFSSYSPTELQVILIKLRLSYGSKGVVFSTGQNGSAANVMKDRLLRANVEPLSM
ncbi:hypothetical protein CTI12_AA421270 [Artemisia annua]|uniref:Uncharacterized protein n=1 Tax=Artemisia annua TaxID=35608 RepID=A0A2U1M4H8_ARTAN|nr:hypothetical protein CTI12_AA421270 [Artemisia annua]